MVFKIYLMSKEEFIEFLLGSGVLWFGEVVTKSGRRTPYFINLAKCDDGMKLSALGKFYARSVNENFPDVTLLFGPAYKGISLAVVTATMLYEVYGRTVRVAYNRKEVKDHGEGGVIVGASISQEDKVVIVEDVITSGSSIRESIKFLEENGNPKVLGVVVSVDRMERGLSDKRAKEEIEEEFGIKVVSMVSILDVIEYVKSYKKLDCKTIDLVEKYLRREGVGIRECKV